RRRQPQHGAVGDLARELAHLHRKRRQVDRRRGRPLGYTHAPANAVVTPAEIGAGAQAATQHGDVFAHHGEGLGEGEAELSFHAGAMAHADSEAEATSRRLRERQCGLGHGHGMARINRDDTVAEAEAAGGRTVRGEHDEGVAAKPVSHPGAVVAEGLGTPGEIDGSSEIAAGVQIAGSSHSGSTLTRCLGVVQRRASLVSWDFARWSRWRWRLTTARRGVWWWLSRR